MCTSGKLLCCCTGCFQTGCYERLMSGRDPSSPVGHGMTPQGPLSARSLWEPGSEEPQSIREEGIGKPREGRK